MVLGSLTKSLSTTCIIGFIDVKAPAIIKSWFTGTDCWTCLSCWLTQLRKNPQLINPVPNHGTNQNAFTIIGW